MKYNKIIIITVLSLLIFSCKKKNIEVEKNIKIEIDTIYNLTTSKVNSEGVFLFNTGNDILINWTEWHKEKEKNILKFAFFDKNKGEFGESITIASSLGLQMHAESMAKVGLTKNGIIYAVYRKKVRSNRSMFGGTMYYTISTDKGKTWSDEVKLVSNLSSTSQAFYDIALLPDGEIGIVWLDSRMPIHKDRDGKTLYFAKTNTDKGFQNETAIAGSTCECCRTEIYVDKNNNIHIAYRNIIEQGEEYYDDDLGNTDVEIRDMYYISSKDNAKTFSKPIPISLDNWHIYGCPHTGPSLAFDGDNLSAVWFTAANNDVGIFFATKTGKQFNERKLLTNEGRHPQMIVLNNQFYIVYEEYYEKDGKGYTKIILTSISKNNFNDTVEISKKQTNNNHAVLTQLEDDSILIAWVNDDTRNPKIVYKILKQNTPQD